MDGRTAGGQDDMPRLHDSVFRTETAVAERRVERGHVDPNRGVVRPGDLDEYPLIAGLTEIHEHIVIGVNPA